MKTLIRPAVSLFVLLPVVTGLLYPAAADYQAARVARARGLDAARMQELIARHTEGRDLGMLGEARVNVLKLNLALDQR